MIPFSPTLTRTDSWAAAPLAYLLSESYKQQATRGAREQQPIWFVGQAHVSYYICNYAISD